MSEIDAAAVAREEIRVLRGQVLRVLHAAMAAGGMKRQVLGRVVAGDDRRVDEALSYLAIAKLAEKEEVKLDRLDRNPLVYWKITAAGVQVVEGTAADGGVDMNA